MSRLHAMILFSGSSFVLQDVNSKFGTLVLIRDKLELNQRWQKSVQVGRTVVNFLIRKNQIPQPTKGDFLAKNKAYPVLADIVEEVKS